MNSVDTAVGQGTQEPNPKWHSCREAEWKTEGKLHPQGRVFRKQRHFSLDVDNRAPCKFLPSFFLEQPTTRSAIEMPPVHGSASALVGLLQEPGQLLEGCAPLAQAVM